MDRTVYARMAAHEDYHWWFVARRAILARLIAVEKPAKSELSLLEVGCGTGGNLALLKRFGRVEACEYDAEAREWAQRKSAVDVRPGALPADIEMPAAGYDMIFLLDVLEHVEQDEASLRALAKRLAPGGRIVLTVPALPWLWSDHDVRHHHFRRYTLRSLRAVADRAGLRPIRVGYFNTLLFPLAVAARLARRALGLKGEEDSLPGRTVNALLTEVFGLERFLVGRIRLPVGLSLFMVAAVTG
ncbi:MAG TPA: class I SAM-dependent methyltransferase [Hyphomicrobiales bacterium]|nr:class I SAM-dependent methyltransferase [Hyphomicrobiales bacterium]